MKNKRQLYVIMYHYVRDYKNTRFPKIKGMDITEFENQVEFLKNEFYIVTMEEIIGYLKGETSIPDQSVLLTFDDGYLDHYKYVFPILRKYNAQGSFFIPAKSLEVHELLDVNKIHYILASQDITVVLEDLKCQIDDLRTEYSEVPEYSELYSKYACPGRWDNEEVVFVKKMLQGVLPERMRNLICSNLFEKYIDITEEEIAQETYMSREQITLLRKEGMHIGVHGYEHYWLGNLEQSEMEQDVNKAVSLLSEYIDKDAWSICYPKGSYSDDVIQYCENKGAKVGFTADHGVVNLDNIDRMRLPRIDCNFFPPISEKFKGFYI